MEPKKNPKYDVHRKRGVIFNCSLVLSLLIVIVAFKWAVPIREQYQPPRSQSEPETLILDPVKATSHAKQEEARPKVVKTKLPNVGANIVEIANSSKVTTTASVFDQGDTVSYTTPSATVDLPEEKEPEIWINVEKMPEPVGGLEGFYNTLRKNLKYPNRARRMGTEGRVFVQFTIDENGGLSDFNVLRGIGNGCDEEAIRVIALTKWFAGKQRGRPVKVRMVQPVYFSLEKNR